MNILITGASGGIGTAVTARFLSLGHDVYGLDREPASVAHPRYRHFQTDLRNGDLPDVPDAAVLFLNAGSQNGEDDIDNNLKAAMRVTEKYIRDNPALRSVLFNASASAVTGQEFPAYAASKAGLVGYMKNVAVRLAPQGVTCNALSLGGVLTPLNDPVVHDPACWARIMAVTPLKKWMSADEVADWVVFLTLTNRSMSGQNLLIDNGEHDLNATFVWPDEN
ncbi:MAG: SDR family oxidoreductase [Eubacteriales bacterium]|nr:SDR family oxidoreductase [Eubacteriales bacterium]